tara:strand:+ start:8246 stop:8488 length:243 start_codon:yes stop_codon:yes gene_type:complete
MELKKRKITQVYLLPDTAEERSGFADGLVSLAKQFNVQITAGSVHDEISYVEILEKELSEHISESGVEDIRQIYEHSMVE